MSTCRDIRRLMLEADPESLAGGGSDSVSEHVRQCAACAAAARTILEETASLDRHLAAPFGTLDVEGVLEAALGPAETPPQGRPEGAAEGLPEKAARGVAEKAAQEVAEKVTQEVAEKAAQELSDGAGIRRTERPGILPLRNWRRWAGMAAAAAVAGLFFLNPDTPTPTPLPRVAQTPPLVEDAPNQNVAVLETANPEITVLWFF